MGQLKENQVVIECKGRLHGVGRVLALTSGDSNWRKDKDGKLSIRHFRVS